MRRRTVVVILVIAAVVAGGVWGFLHSQGRVRRLASGGDRINVLLIGLDGVEDSVRCAVTAIASLSSGGAASVLVVPTGLRLRSDVGGMDTVASLYETRGPAALADSLAAFLGVDILFHVEAGFAMLERAIDASGPLEVLVGQPFSCSDSTSFPALDFSLTTGSQRLSGAEVIAYLRCADADSRGRGLLAQQEVLAGMMRAGMGLP
ncbi:MAG: LCP family protein, partial [Candidatus Bipolaricaulota bacterium]